MSETVKINSENKSEYVKWTPYSEGNTFLQFIKILFSAVEKLQDHH